MDITKLKKIAALEATKHISRDDVVGIGTGTTVEALLEVIKERSIYIKAAIASSIATQDLLQDMGVEVVEFNAINEVNLYIDGADQVNSLGQMIKGCRGALAREKVLASCAKKFICIIDETKQGHSFGYVPVPVEVVPMASSYVARQCVVLGGTPRLRENFLTDNGNIILDVDFGVIEHPIQLEQTLNNIPGVLANGIFSQSCNQLIVGTKSGAKTYFFADSALGTS